MSDDIQLDEEVDTPPPASPKKTGLPVWMVIVVVLGFAVLAGTLTMQFLEYRYYRGGAPSDADPYAATAVLPSA